MNKCRIYRACLLLALLLLAAARAEAASVAPAPVPKVKVRGSEVTLRWTRDGALTGYKVYLTDSAGNIIRRVKKTTGNSITLRNMKEGRIYYYRVRGYQKKNGKTRYTAYSRVVRARAQETKGKSTLKTLLLTGLEPVGSTMYVWGGGWNEADNGAGTAARSIGVSPQWEKFFRRQTSSYNYQNTRYQIENGLDCSGYIGWCIYNILNTTSGNKGYVMLAQNMAQDFASRGWGSYRAAGSVSDYRAGDIMSSSGHVWMAVGACADGSVVLLHSSPPGVQLAGTAAKNGSANSQAVKLATQYMKKYFPEWYKKFPNCAKDFSYLTQYAQMRWDLTGNAVMTDPDGYRNKDAAAILKDLFASR